MPDRESAEETFRCAAVIIQLGSEYEIRVAAAARDQRMSVEEFVADSIERALRPIENRRRVAARDILELEALWSVGEAGEPPRG